MKLDFEQIKKITSGAVEVIRDRDAIVFHKCTANQTLEWFGLREELGKRALTTTGIRLDFHTDSRSFAFETVSGQKFDLYINGLLTQHLKPHGSESFSFELPEGDTRVMLVFPSHSVGSLRSVELDDGAYVRRHRYSSRILFIGDSITQGWDAEFDSLSFAWRTALHYNADCIINAIGGAVFHPAANDSIPFDPDIVIVALGTNDAAFCSSAESLKENAEGVFSFLASEYPDARRVAITPIWRADDDKVRKTGTFEGVRRIVADAAAASGAEVIDGYTLVPHFSELFADKTLHPNDAGFMVYAENLTAALGKIKRKQKAPVKGKRS